ncbi:hypothetical protein CDL15_Pgr019552 [Punica granatum]|uniref:Uncharacterized protein n=1 Tax=Punica granatum TaxID=22663 RepID=A0A218X7B9_PUNGR|nr:hypothetical protein CDL15_Pgr019552 [Punica granatum]
MLTISTNELQFLLVGHEESRSYAANQGSQINSSAAALANAPLSGILAPFRPKFITQMGATMTATRTAKVMVVAKEREEGKATRRVPLIVGVAPAMVATLHIELKDCRVDKANPTSGLMSFRVNYTRIRPVTRDLIKAIASDPLLCLAQSNPLWCPRPNLFQPVSEPVQLLGSLSNLQLARA